MLLIQAVNSLRFRSIGALFGLCVLLAAFTSSPAGANPLSVTGQVPQVIGGPVAAFIITSPAQHPGSNPTAHVQETVTFDASASKGNGLTYGWYFGDGTPGVSGQKAIHTYSQVDDYQVTLAIVDASGANTSNTQSLRIMPAIQAAVSNPPNKQVAIGAVVPVTLYLKAPGPSVITAKLNGDLINSPAIQFATGDDLAYAQLSGQVANEANPTIDQSIIRTPGGTVPLKGAVGVELTYNTSSGSNVDLVYQLDLQKDLNPAQGTWSITYPDFSIITGKTDPSQPDENGYYLKGDANFHHPNDPDVRRYAMIAARAGGPLPDDPAQVMENVYSYVTGLLGSDDPANLDSDTTVVQKIDDGILVPGARAEKYICIGQTYFLSSLSRTLGLPSRELTIALANPVSQNASGAWTVDYVQEGATEVWYNSSWHLYDTWLKVRQLDDYLLQKYGYQAWYANSPQTTQLIAKNGDPLGLYGHDFAIGEFEGFPANYNEWNYRASRQRNGVTIVDFPTS
jgi:PKD repeat protein